MRGETDLPDHPGLPVDQQDLQDLPDQRDHRHGQPDHLQLQPGQHNQHQGLQDHQGRAGMIITNFLSFLFLARKFKCNFFSVFCRPIAVAQVKTPVRSESPSLNQIPRQSKAKSDNRISENKQRKGKSFRSRSGRNRIFPPPPNIPETNFNCGNYEFPGLYADTETNCEVSHTSITT